LRKPPSAAVAPEPPESGAARLTRLGGIGRFRATHATPAAGPASLSDISGRAVAGLAIRTTVSVIVMKVRNSLKSLRSRHRDNRLVRRKGRLYVINKTQRKFKARQG